MQGGLIYVGDGGYVLDVPARDLTEAEAELYGREMLLRSGLYKEPTTKDLGGSHNKLVTPGKEDKNG